jgi:N-acetylglucosaminyl-diphospho-decaprenol L-rhamnosyltransferase
MPERERHDDQGRLATVAAPPGIAHATLDLSVCIVNWNCRDVLRDCLLSLRQQSLGLRYEVIVVDNASADGAAEMVHRDFPEVRLHRNADNAGFSRANNQAARLANGKYLLFLNNDTVVPPGVLHQLADFLEAHPKVVMVGPRLRDERGKLQMSHRRQPTPATFLHRTWLFRILGVGREGYRQYRRQDQGGMVPRDVDILMGAAVAMPRTAFLGLGGWDEDFTFGGEDMELCHRAARAGRVVYWPEVEITHLGSISSKRHVGFACTQSAIGFAKYFRKTGASRPSLVCYKLAITLDAPLRLCVRAVQYLWRRCRGRERKAAKCLREVCGVSAFLTRGLTAFWRA